MNLPQPIADLTNPLFELLPLESAMPVLVPACASAGAAYDQVDVLLSNPLIQKSPELAAALWLYVDDLDRSHSISQNLAGPVGSLWHGIMHRREGDFWNSKYWFRQTGSHPGLASMNPSEFVDQVEARHKSNPPDLLQRQRTEWASLFEWCANNGVEGI